MSIDNPIVLEADQGPDSRPINPWWRRGPQPDMIPCEVQEVGGIGTDFQNFPLSNTGFPGVPVYISGTTADGYPQVKTLTFATVTQYFGISSKPAEQNLTIDIITSGVALLKVSATTPVVAGQRLQFETDSTSPNVIGDVTPVQDMYKIIEVDTSAGVAADTDIALPEDITDLVGAYVFDVDGAAGDEFTALAVIADGTLSPGAGNISQQSAGVVRVGDIIAAGDVLRLIVYQSTIVKTTQIGIALEAGAARTGADRGQYTKIKVLLTPN